MPRKAHAMIPHVLPPLPVSVALETMVPHGPAVLGPGFLCERCLDAPAVNEQEAPWGGMMGVCQRCRGVTTHDHWCSRCGRILHCKGALPEEDGCALALRACVEESGGWCPEGGCLWRLIGVIEETAQQERSIAHLHVCAGDMCGGLRMFCPLPATGPCLLLFLCSMCTARQREDA